MSGTQALLFVLGLIAGYMAWVADRHGYDTARNVWAANAVIILTLSLVVS